MSLANFVRIFFVNVFYMHWFCNLLDLLNKKKLIKLNSIPSTLNEEFCIEIHSRNSVFVFMQNKCSVSRIVKQAFYC